MTRQDGVVPVDAPSRSDRFVTGLAQVIGGRVGDHATGGPATGGFWTPGRIVLALTCFALAAHWLQKSPCRDGETWVAYGQLRRVCYTDVFALYGAPGGLSQGGVPYLDYPLEYPVLTGVFMAMIGLPVHALATHFTISEFTWFYDLTALSLSLIAVGSVVMMLSLRRRRPWDIAMFAAAPALLLSATVNWDLLAVGLAVGGIYAWARRNPVLAGVLLGLGAAAKLWPGFLLLPIVLLAYRAGRNRPAWIAAGYAAGTLAGVNLLVILGDYLTNGNIDNWLRFLRLNTERPIDWGTFWYVAQYLDRAFGPSGGPFQWLGTHVDPSLNWLTYALFGLACAGIGWLALAAPRRPRLAALAFLVVAAFLLTSKVWSQQYVVWLLPLVVLARPRWGAFLAWQAAEVAYFFTFYGQLLRAVPAEQRPEGLWVMPEGWFILAASMRWFTVALLCGLVVYDALHPREDVVRDTYEDDPDGGVLDGAPDFSTSGSEQMEDDDAVDLLAGDAQPVASGAQGGLPRGADDPVGQDDHRNHPD
jgi:glycosyl transferase family 87